jgi:hypothetical protein
VEHSHNIEREPSKFIAAVSGGWPKITSNPKSLLKTGSIVLQEPYPIQSAHSGKVSCGEVTPRHERWWNRDMRRR